MRVCHFIGLVVLRLVCKELECTLKGHWPGTIGLPVAQLGKCFIPAALTSGQSVHLSDKGSIISDHYAIRTRNYEEPIDTVPSRLPGTSNTELPVS